jgi:hypothetical protein
MWNDTDTPLAYLITFRCHGTWLHGDERGSVDRFHNRYKSPCIEPIDLYCMGKGKNHQILTEIDPVATAPGSDLTPT